MKMKIAVGIIVSTLMLVSVATATSFTPTTIEETLNPGESISETKTVVTDTTPIGKADIIFSFDLTGSMGGIIGTAKSDAIEIMNAVDAEVPDAQYGVVSYMDYPYYYSSFDYSATYGDSYWWKDYSYRLDQSITGDKSAVSSAINGLVLGSGGDGPQDYTRVMYESYADSSIGYRSGSKKILVNFGDNVPHDNNLNEGVPGKSGVFSTGGDPGRNEIMDETFDPSKIGIGNDDLDLQTILNGMKTNGVTLLEVHTTTSYSDYWKYWTGVTGGDVYVTGSDSAAVKNAIVSLVKDTVSSIDTLTLEVEPEYESWVTWTPEKYTDVGGSQTKVFDVKITVPAGTAPGTYNFEIKLVADGAVLAVQTVTIHVPGEETPGEETTDIPEFPTVALPMIAILGLMFVIQRRKE